MKPSLPRASRDAFTLIEILVVIAIIAILASLLLNTAGFIQEKAGTSRAQAEIATLKIALENYRIDNGDYPKTDSKGTLADGSDGSSLVLLNVLNREPSENDTKIYLTELGKMIPPIPGNSSASYASRVAAATQLVDPFGNPYRYEYPGKDDRSGTNFFDLWSQGKKNSPDTNKWIKGW